MRRRWLWVLASTIAVAALLIAVSLVPGSAATYLPGPSRFGSSAGLADGTGGFGTHPGGPVPGPVRQTSDGTPPRGAWTYPTQVIGHRGASSVRPEHTLEAYRLAIEAGADFIEPDLVSTRDGVLIARHENEISATTDVAHHPEFADHKRTKRVGGQTLTGWFTEDFTLAELRTLRAREREPRRRPVSSAYDGQFAVPTLTEVIDLIRSASARHGRQIGMEPELKDPAYFASIGLPMEHRLIEELAKVGWTDAKAPVFIQSFDSGALRKLHAETSLRLEQLVMPGPGGDHMVTAAGMDAIGTYAIAVGVDKSRIQAALAASPNTDSVLSRAHFRAMGVRVFTFSEDNVARGAYQDLYHQSDPPWLRDALAEFRAYYRAGVDAVFTDNPAVAVRARW